jgi:hypothetical protein
VIRHPYFDDVTQQVFLDNSGVDRAYSDKSVLPKVSKKPFYYHYQELPFGTNHQREYEVVIYR